MDHGFKIVLCGPVQGQVPIRQTDVMVLVLRQQHLPVQIQKDTDFLLTWFIKGSFSRGHLPDQGKDIQSKKDESRDHQRHAAVRAAQDKLSAGTSEDEQNTEQH